MCQVRAKFPIWESFSKSRFRLLRISQIRFGQIFHWLFGMVKFPGIKQAPLTGTLFGWTGFGQLVIKKALCYPHFLNFLKITKINREDKKKIKFLLF